MDPHSFNLLDPDPHSEKLLDPDPHKMNADPQPCLFQRKYAHIYPCPPSGHPKSLLAVILTLTQAAVIIYPS